MRGGGVEPWRMVTVWSVAADGDAAAQTLGRAAEERLPRTGGPRRPPCGCRAGGGLGCGAGGKGGIVTSATELAWRRAPHRPAHLVDTPWGARRESVAVQHSRDTDGLWLRRLDADGGALSVGSRPAEPARSASQGGAAAIRALCRGVGPGSTMTPAQLYMKPTPPRHIFASGMRSRAHPLLHLGRPHFFAFFAPAPVVGVRPSHAMMRSRSSTRCSTFSNLITAFFR